MAGSGFEAQFNKESLSALDNKEKYEDLGQVTIEVDLDALGVSLEDAPVDMKRTYYMAHKLNDGSVEYLSVYVSSDKNKATFKTDSTSPFALVYKDVKNTPSQPIYVLPVTGIE